MTTYKTKKIMMLTTQTLHISMPLHMNITLLPQLYLNFHDHHLTMYYFLFCRICRWKEVSYQQTVAMVQTFANIYCKKRTF